jgi:hypothetical protein
MLAHMHRNGLGTPQDAARGIRWLRAVTDERFNPMFDTLRSHPSKPGATNARIEAAMALAHMYQIGSEVGRNRDEAQRWYAKAIEFGFIPDLAAQTGQPGAFPAIASMSAPGAPAPGTLGTAVVKAMAPGATANSAADTAADTASDAAASDPADIASDTLSQALPELSRNPASTEPVVRLRRPTDALQIATTSPAESQGPAGDVMFVVHVTGLRAVPWKSYGAMRAAVSAHKKYQSLAPDAVFRFAVMPPEGATLPPNFALRVRTEKGQEFPIRLDHGELFTLPLLPDLDGKADLVSNFKGGALRIGLLVHTPAIPAEKLRLGDLRLRDEITAAILMFDQPWEYDAQCKGRGRWSRCKLPSKVIWHRPWAAANGAWIVEGTRRTPLQANDDPKNRMYRMPIASKDWGNDAIIEFDYQDALRRPRKLSEAAIYDGID